MTAEQISEFNTVQHLVIPDFQFDAHENMYFRVTDDDNSRNGVRNLPSINHIEFKAGCRALFDTFFNSLTIHTWKQNCNLEDLYLELNGHGRFSVRFGLHHIGSEPRWLEEQVIDLDNTRPIKINSWDSLESGMLYFSLQALDDAYIEGGRFVTSTEPNHNLKLGIVITHFNRKHYVLPAIRRIRNNLLINPAYREKIELVVVDNSQNITAEEAEGITLVTNKNLGGSGGFTRGLLHLIDNGSFTHCLFMDDDASCEIESICRTFNFLTFTRPEARVAIAGSLLRELSPGILHEKGARFDGNWRPIGSGLNMYHVHDLLHAEVNDIHPSYGAWWFFAFPIHYVRRFPFPFFVRGDDILFSLQNNFNIITMNGIGCWGEDFEVKEGPLTRYLGFRGTTVISILMGYASAKSILKQLATSYLAALLSYNYASAAAIRWAILDVLKGPQFFIDNIDTTDIRKRIGEIASAEALKPIYRNDYSIDYSPIVTENRIRTAIRLITLNGFLLPSFFMKKRAVFQPKSFRSVFRQIFRYRHVYYEYEYSKIGYIAEHNKRKLFAGLAEFTITCLTVIFKLNRVKQQYRMQAEYLTSDGFWRSIYRDDIISLDKASINECKNKDSIPETNHVMPVEMKHHGHENERNIID